jgi:NRAMP (natural resistance-associated macrophage protein)-like metal ion transporter
MLWIALITTPMMAVIQGMCSRLSMVTGRGLASLMRTYLPRWLTIVLAIVVIVANTFNVGADIAGMAAAANLLVPIPLVLLVVFFGGAILALQLFLSYSVIAKTFKWLAVTLLAYVITAFVVHPPWGQVLVRTFIPEVHWNETWLSTAVGVLGTTITPYLFFWQGSLEVEEEKEHGLATAAKRRGTTEEHIRVSHTDVNTGMIFSNLVALFIMITTASTLGAHGLTHIVSAQQAAEALRPLAGNFAYLLFTLGMVGTGFLAIPALAGSSAYITAEIFRFREGLNEPPKRARKFYGVIAIGIIVGIIINFVHIDPIAALFWSAVLNGIAAVPLIAVIVLFASNKKIMGKWVSSPTARAWGWFSVLMMGAAAIGFFITSFHH